VINVNLNNELSHALEQMAHNLHQPIEELINEAISEKLADYHDIKTAEEVINKIKNGEERLIPWKQVKENT
jgi:predicted DNA-binding protein